MFGEDELEVMAEGGAALMAFGATVAETITEAREAGVEARWCDALGAAVADREASLIITGNGDVLEPELGIVAIGSGGAYAQAAARALLAHTELAPAEMVKKSLEIAGDICIYTNQSHVIETLE